MARLGIESWRSNRSRFARAVFVGLIVFSTAASAHAGSWAKVLFDGTLEKSRGVLANFRDGPGSYRIVFRRSIAKCVPMVSPMIKGDFVVVSETGNPGEVRIFSYDRATQISIDTRFYVALVC